MKIKMVKCHSASARAMKAVLFDLGHTLIDYYCNWRGPQDKGIKRMYGLVAKCAPNPPSESEFYAYLNSALEKVRERQLREMVEIPLSQTLGRCLERYSCQDEEVLNESLEIFYNVLVEERKLCSGAPELLSKLKEEGYAIGLISDVAWGLPSKFPQNDMRFYGIHHYFDDLVFSTDVGLRKPHPKIFKIALSNLGSSAQEAVFVGNSLQQDIKGARGVGMKSILKKSFFCPLEDGVQPDAKAESLDEVEDLIKDLLA